MAEEYKTGSGYGKRPLWQWVLIYLIVGAVVYGLVYYFILAKKGGGYGPNYGSSNSGQPSPSYK